MSLRIRRGTDEQRRGVVFDSGEIVWTTDQQQLWIGTGAQPAGGVSIAAGIAGSGLVFNPSTGKLDVSGLSITTDDVPQGDLNKYFTNELAQDAVADALVNGTHQGITFIYNTPQDTGNRIDATVSLSLDSLTDVVISNTPTNGQVLKYNAAAQVWEPGAGAAGSVSVLNDLDDVVITGTPTNGQVLKYNSISQAWESGNETSGITAVIDDLSPKLGGDLDLNNNDITGVGNITVTGSVRAGNIIVDSSNITSPNPFSLGTVSSPADLTLNLSTNLNTYQVIEPAGVGGGYVIVNRCRGSLLSPTAVQPGDELGGFLINAQTSPTTTGIAGLLGFLVDPTAVIAGGDFVKSQVIISASTDTGQDVENALLLDSAGKATSNAFVASKYMQLAVYADDAARSAAIPTPVQGMMVFMQSGTLPSVTNKTVVYDGASWVAIH